MITYSSDSLRKLASLAFVALFGLLIQSQAVSASSPEEIILTHTNHARKKAHLAPLRFNGQLRKVAKEQSISMAKTKTLSHEVNGNGLAARIKKHGYAYRNVGENIAYGCSPSEVVRLWMKSPGHKKNILNPKFAEIGIGIARANDGSLYITQVFGKSALKTKKK